MPHVELTQVTTKELPPTSFRDEHGVLLWQTCAYAVEVTDAAGAGEPLTPAYDALLAFLHYRLLPYLAEEEREFARGRLHDNHMARLVLADHSLLRSDVDNIERSRSRTSVRLTTGTLHFKAGDQSGGP